MLAHIIHQRTQEIFEIVLRQVEEAGLIKKLAAGVVVTGGAAAQPGTANLASDIFGTGARLGVPGEFLGGLADSVQAPRYATVTGLVQYGAHRVAIGTRGGKGRRLSTGAATPSMDHLAARFKTWRKTSGEQGGPGGLNHPGHHISERRRATRWITRCAVAVSVWAPVRLPHVVPRVRWTILRHRSRWS